MHLRMLNRKTKYIKEGLIEREKKENVFVREIKRERDRERERESECVFACEGDVLNVCECLWVGGWVGERERNQKEGRRNLKTKIVKERRKN